MISVVANSSVNTIWYANENQNVSDICKKSEISNYPDWLTYKPPRYDIMTLCLFICAYLFIWMAIVCDEYCIPAIESLCFKTLRLSYNVAGATFLAVVTSVPEFFCSLYGTFLTESGLGIGTIVGSSVFNLLVITAICAFRARSVCLDWWPVTRDLGLYSMSIGMVTLFMVDYEIIWYEAVVMILFFAIIMTCLANDDRLQKLRNRNRQCPCICFRPPGEVADFQSPSSQNDENKASDQKGDDSEENINDGESFNFAKWPSSHIKKIWWIIIYPIHCLLFITIPDINRCFSHKWSTLSLIMSIAWVGLISFLISWMLTVIGFNINVLESVMGLTILAVGTSLPEAITSYIITAKGYGSMAVCNAISSNSFDVLFGLGVPWFIKCLMNSNGIDKYSVQVEASDMVGSIFILFVSILFLYILFMAVRFRLCIPIGIFCLVGYCSYVAMATFFEFSSDWTPSVCPINFK